MLFMVMRISSGRELWKGACIDEMLLTNFRVTVICKMQQKKTQRHILPPCL